MISILVPTLALDISLLQRLADSIDFPIQNKVVINNGKPGSLDEWKLKNPSWNVIQSEYNLGVAASWNLAPEIFKEDAWLILNDDQQLQPGCLEIIASESELHYKTADIIYVNPFEAFDIFVWTRKGFETFGSFDENFYPAYYEDWEMRLRFNIGGADVHIIGDESFPVKHGKPKPAGVKYMNMLKSFDHENRMYFMSKWGIIGDKNQLYKTPYNNPDLKIKDWEFNFERRAVMMEIWNEFINDKEVSLY